MTHALGADVHGMSKGAVDPSRWPLATLMLLEALTAASGPATAHGRHKLPHYGITIKEVRR
jgi:hypothetical protein